MKMEKAIENVLNIVAQVDALREDTLEKLKSGINVNTELISAMGRLMNTVADILPGKIDSLEWKKLYEDMQINQLPADFCDYLEEWENEVYKWCEFQKGSFRTCNMCHHRVQYIANPEHFQTQQKIHGFPWWNAVFESISMVNRTCPECQSIDRERMIVLFLDMLKPEGSEKLKVLQIAPSHAMDHWLREKEYIDYETTDLYIQGVTFQSDIQNMFMVEDETYDIIICSHILEHVRDDQKAMRELSRILKKDGVCLFLVPLVIGLNKTDEEFGLSADENWKRFGQDDHARLYGKRDFLDRLTNAGFLVHILNADYFEEDDWKQAGLSDIHCLYAASKEDIGIGVEPYRIEEDVSQELVSVVIPTYNRGYCIERAVNSVLNQTWKNLEVIVVDDASTDNTDSVISQVQDERLCYIKLEKKAGANHARNVGIKNAKGHYIAFNDSDDEWLPKKLDKQMQLMKLQERIEGDKVGAVYCIMSRYDKDGHIRVMPEMKSLGENGIGDIYTYMQGQMFISTQMLLFRKSVLEDVGYFNEDLKRLQDWELLLRVSQKYRFSLVQEPLVNVYVQEDCISNNVKAWTDTVLFAIGLHDMAINNTDAYEALIKVAVKLMKDAELPKDYLENFIEHIEEDGVFGKRQIDKFKEDIGIATDGIKDKKNCEKNEMLNIDEKSARTLNESMFFEIFQLIMNGLSGMDKKIDSLQEEVRQNNRLMNEVLWAQVFNSSRSAYKWLGKDVALWPGRWGVGYQYMYVVSRLLNEVRPKSILETGLGQSTRLIGSYVKWMVDKQKCSHLVLEHDKEWIDIFKNDFQVSEATEIIQRDLGAVEYQQQNGTMANMYMYLNLEEIMKDRKFDFISIDGPYGVNDKNGYSRIDILNYFPACLKESFCIVMDDYERWGEKNTVECMKAVLKEQNIAFCETVYRGTQDMYLMVSPDWKFLCTL